MEGYKLVIKGVDFSNNAIGGKSFDKYIIELKKHYTLTSEEEEAINDLFSVLGMYYSKFKLLYLFVGDNAEAHSLNAVDPEKYKLEYINGTRTHTKKGISLSTDQVIDTQYFPTADELNNFTMFGCSAEVSWNGRNDTYIGFRVSDNSNRMGLCRNVQGNGVTLYYIPNSGGSYDSSLVRLRDTRMKLGSWHAASVRLGDDGVKMASVYSGLRTLPDPTIHQDITNWKIVANRSFNLFGESANNSTGIAQGGWANGYGQAIAFLDYLEEGDIVTIGDALAKFNKTIRNL